MERRNSILLKSLLSLSPINVYIFTAFITGIFAGWHNIFAPIVLILLSLVSFLGLILSVRSYRAKLFPAVLVVFFILLGALWVTPYSLHKPSLFLSGNNRFVIKVTSLPQERRLKRVFYAHIARVNGYPVSINVKVNCFYGGEIKYRGSYVVDGRLKRYKLRNYYFYTLWVRKNSFVRRLPENLVDNFVRSFTYRVIAYFKNNLSCEAYKFVSSVFLGRRELLDKKIKSVFINASAAHLIAISGLHVGIISAAFFFILKIFRIRFRARILIAIIVMFLYTLCAGARPSTVRSSLMFSFMGIGFLLKRKVSIFDTLSLSGIVCLFLNPLWVFDAGFQLSFAAVFAIAAGVSLFPAVFTHRYRLISYIKGMFFSALFVLMAIAPLISFYFGRFYPISVLSNLMLIPIFTLVIVTVLTFICFCFSHFLADILGSALSLFVHIFIKTAEVLGSIKFSSIDISINLIGMTVYYAMLAVVIILIRLRRQSVRGG